MDKEKERERESENVTERKRKIAEEISTKKTRNKKRNEAKERGI